LFTFWYFILIVLLVIFGIAKLYNYLTGLKVKTTQRMPTQVLLMIPAILIFYIGARGGLQSKAISPVTSLQYVDAPLSPLVYNTCFSLGTSFKYRRLEEQKYFSDDASLNKYFSQTHCYYKDTLPRQK